MIIHSTLAYIDRPGRSAELIKAFDWDSSPLGEPATWPQSLKTAVGIVLGSGQACNLIWGPDLITFYNDAYAPMMGSLPDGIGRPYPDFRPDVWPFVEKQIRAGFSGQPTTAENITILTKRHGSASEAYFTLNCAPVFDETGSVGGVISYISETTKTVLAQRTLEDQNSLLRQGLNRLPQMVWSTLPDGYHDFYNDPWYEFTGVAPGSTDGDGWNELFHPDDRDRAWSLWRHSLRTGEPYEIHYRLKHHSGGYRWTLGRALPGRDSTGKINRWYGTCTDIHDHVLAQEKLQALQAELVHVSRLSAMGSMAATLAHEVNQPLTAAANFASGLRKHLATGASMEAFSEAIAGIEGSVLRAGEIIRRLRKSVQGHDPQMEGVSAAALVYEVRLLLREECSKLLVETDLEQGAMVHCDPIQVQQVLTNLIRNACEAVGSDGKGKIVITTRSVGERVRFTVEDNGPGLELGSENSIFAAFTPSSKGGMGLGLAISRTIVEAHGGEIKAENRLPRGACFYFELPKHSVSARAEEDDAC